MLFYKDKDNLFLKVVVSIYRATMEISTKIAYIPILQMYIYMYKCDNEKHYLSGDYACWTSKHYIHIGIGLPFMIIFFIHSYYFTKLHFETDYNYYNALTRRTNFSEVSFLFEKLAYVLIIDFIPTENYNISIILMFLISLYSYLSYSYSQPDYNFHSLKLKLMIRLIFFWSMTSLFLSYIIIKIYDEFKSTLILFLAGLPFIILIALGFNVNDISLEGISEIDDNIEFIKKINAFQRKIDNYDKREYQLDLKGYATSQEQKCILQDCPLCKYIECMDNKNEAIVYLELYLDSLFQRRISRFSNNVSLRLWYFIFLKEKMNKKHKALNEIKVCEQYDDKTFEEDFIVFRYKKIYEEIGEFKEDDYLSHSNGNTMYLNILNKLKLQISKITLLYIDFWTLLYQNHLEHQQNLTQLNNFGTAINSEVKEIKRIFEHLQKLKGNDLEVMKIYHDFLTEILFDNENAKALRLKIKEVEELNYEEKSHFDKLGNFDLSIVNKIDQEYFIIINATKNTITNISLGLCPFLGYTKRELLGKDINILIPSAFHFSHKKMLQNKFENFRKEKDIKEGIKKSMFEKNVTFAITKSRYIVPFGFKCQLNQTELNDVFWIVNVVKDKSMTFKRSEIDINSTVCYLITNNIFNIQNVTSNCVKHLDLDSSAINNANDIIFYIREFQEEFLHFATTDKEEKSNEEKLRIKKEIVSKILDKPTFINWRKRDDDPEFSSNYDEESLMLKRYLKKNEGLLMTAKQVNFGAGNGIDGYIFKFEKSNAIKSKCATNENLLVIKRKRLGISTNNAPLSLASPKIKGTVLGSPHYSNNFHEKINNNFEIQPDFIPKLGNDELFVLDPEKLSFKKRKYSSTSKLKALDVIKSQAMKKVLNDEEKRSTSSTYSSEEELSSESKSKAESSSSSNGHSSDDDLEESNTSSEKCLEKEKHKKETLSIKDEYYKVNLTKVKLSVINFERNIFKEYSFKKISKVEEIISNHNTEMVGTNSTSSEEKRLSKEEFKPYQTTDIPMDLKSAIPQPPQKESIIEQIHASLNRHETQPIIVKLQAISFFVFLVLVCNGALFYAVSVATLKGLIDKNQRMISSFLLTRYNLLASNYVRELVMVNFDECDDYYLPKEDYKESLKYYLKEFYQNGTEQIKFLITHSDDLKEENYYAIFNSTIRVSSLEYDYSVSYHNISLISAVTKSFSSLFQIGQLDKVISLNRDVFYFLENSLNNIFISINTLSRIYKEELSAFSDKQNKKLSTIYGAISGLILLSCIPLLYTFEKVMEKKESYLEVFYEINGKDIVYSLTKCEEFVQKLQNEENGGGSTYDNNDASFSILSTPEEKQKKINKKSGSHSSNQEHQKISKERMIIKIFFFFYLLLSISYIIMLGLFFNHFCKRIPNFTALYSSQSNLQSTAYLVGNNLREYMFDTNSRKINVPLMYSAPVMVNSARMSEREMLEIIMNYQSYLGEEFINLQKEVYYNDICDYIETYFGHFFKERTDYTCDNFLFGSGRLGFSIVQSTYYEEIRQMLQFFSIYTAYWKKHNFTYNLTLYGTPGFDDLPPRDPELAKLYHSFSSTKLLCSDKMKKLEITENSIIIPMYNKLLTKVEEGFLDEIDAQILLFRTTSLIYMIITVLFYFLCWNKSILTLQVLIYKTKNMLSIIPSELLVDLNSIHKLLNISTTTNNGNV